LIGEWPKWYEFSADRGKIVLPRLGGSHPWRTRHEAQKNSKEKNA